MGQSSTSAVLDFLVLKGMSMGIVIGLPSICEHFQEIFFEMISSANSGQEVSEVLLIDPHLVTDQGLQQPWKSATAPINQEDDKIPEPSSFNNDFVMGESYEKSREEFLSQVESRIHPKFQRSTPVLSFLQQVGVDVFVPRDWTGIKGVAPVRLEYKGTPPDRMKPSGRRIPAAIFEASKREFMRLLTYFYQVSTSPINSPIVVAPKTTAPFVRICGDYRQVNKLIKVFNYPIPEVL